MMTMFWCHNFAKHHPGRSWLDLWTIKAKMLQNKMKGHHPLSLKWLTVLSLVVLKVNLKINWPHVHSWIGTWITKLLLKNCWESTLAFVPSPRMFDLSFNEWFSHNKWQRILFYHHFVSLLDLYNWLINNKPTCLILLTFIGYVYFSFILSILHRFVFHSEKWLPNNRIIRYLHYTLYWIHHMLLWSW